jgi:hypothetical protein
MTVNDAGTHVDFGTGGSTTTRSKPLGHGDGRRQRQMVAATPSVPHQQHKASHRHHHNNNNSDGDATPTSSVSFTPLHSQAHQHSQSHPSITITSTTDNQTTDEPSYDTSSTNSIPVHDIFALTATPNVPSSIPPVPSLDLSGSTALVPTAIPSSSSVVPVSDTTVVPPSPSSLPSLPLAQLMAARPVGASALPVSATLAAHADMLSPPRSHQSMMSALTDTRQRRRHARGDFINNNGSISSATLPSSPYNTPIRQQVSSPDRMGSLTTRARQRPVVRPPLPDGSQSARLSRRRVEGTNNSEIVLASPAHPRIRPKFASFVSGQVVPNGTLRPLPSPPHQQQQQRIKQQSSSSSSGRRALSGGDPRRHRSVQIVAVSEPCIPTPSQSIIADEKIPELAERRQRRNEEKQKTMKLLATVTYQLSPYQSHLSSLIFSFSFRLCTA